MQRLVVLAVFLAATLCVVQGQTTAVIKSRYLRGNVTYGGVTIPYRYYVPQNYSSANKYAIITFLHGIGERGSDNDQQLVRAPIILANDTVQSMYKFFIVAPQCPGNTEWQKNATVRAAVKKAVDDLILRYPGIDNSTRFIMGLSLGSAGTWTTVNQFPGVYKKAVPMAAGYGVKAINFRPTKVWTFHSSNDREVPYRATNSTVNTLRNDGQSVLFDDPKQGHVIDEYVLRHYPVIQWLFNDTNTGLPVNPPTCYEYIGCFVDNTTARDLSGYFSSSTNMTVELCDSRCSARGYTYFGLQYASQCFCDSNYGMYGAGLESSCATPCAGNPGQICGGGRRNSVYRITC